MIPQELNFHEALGSNSVYSGHDITINPAIFFNGAAKFNIYLNAVKKFLEPLHGQNFSNLSVIHLMQILSNATCDKLNYIAVPTDLNYNLIWTDSVKFIEELYNMLDRSNILYTKNTTIALDAIDIFKKTCVDPTEYIDNYENTIWLGWCAGVLAYNKKYIGHSLDDLESTDKLASLFIQHRDYFLEQTTPYILNVN